MEQDSLYDYEHTQPGTYIRVIFGITILTVCGILVVIFGAGFAGNEQPIGTFIPVIVFTVILPLFHSLTVRVSTDHVSLSFGVGLIRKRFLIADIETTSVVRNRWYHGWGIKKIRGGWLYNVSGLDAIEIRFKDGRLCRIGTDQPDELRAAVDAAVEQSS